MRAFLAVLFLLASGLAGAQTCTTTLNAGANVASAVAAAANGAVICLNNGSYGTVSLGSFTKSPRVTVRSTTGQGATITNLQINNTANGVTFSSLVIGGGNICCGARNITIAGSNFGTGQLVVDTTNFNANNILIDSSTFGAFTANGTREGRLSIQWAGGPGANPSGVTVTNSTFGPGGCSDGINIGARGVTVGPGNVFTNIVQGSCAPHVDAIQGYGQAATTITGNFFSGNSVDIGYYDGGSSEVFTNNVVLGTSGQSMQMGSIANPLFEHNTVSGGTVNFNGKPENGNTTNLMLRNNLLIGGASINLTQNGTPACTNCTVTHNQFPSGGSGTNNVIGAPTFVGGANPSTWAGWQMTAGSIGHNAGTDGLDMGTLYYGTGGGPPPPTPTTPLAFINAHTWRDLVAGPTTYSLMANVPYNGTLDSDTAALTLGVRFQSSVAGNVTKVGFYKVAGMTGTHTCALYSNTGTLLKSQTVTGETPTGWQYVTFTTPYAAAANTSYKAACFFPTNAKYSATNGALSTSNGPLSTVAPNGLYVYGAALANPTNSNFNANYWVDVIFQ